MNILSAFKTATAAIPKLNFHWALLIFFPFIPLTAHANIINVTCSSSTSLQSIIDSASRGDTINIVGTCPGAITITKSLTLNGIRNGNTLPVIDGNGANFVVRVTSASQANTIVLSNLTLKNARVAGIVNNFSTDDDSLTLINSYLSLPDARGYFGKKNASQKGGKLTIRNCTFYNNATAVFFGSEDVLDFSYNTIYSLQEQNVAFQLGNKSVGGSYGIFSGNFIVTETLITTATFGSVINSTGYNFVISSPSMLFNHLSNDLVLVARYPSGLSTPSDNGGATPTMKISKTTPGYAFITPGTTINDTLLCPNEPPEGAITFLKTDQRNAPRLGVNKPGCDPGAYESGDTRFTITSPSPTNGIYTLYFSAPLHSTATDFVTYQNTGNDTIPNVQFFTSGFYSLSEPTDTSALKAGVSRNQGITFTATVMGQTQSGLLYISPDNLPEQVVNLLGTSVSISSLLRHVRLNIFPKFYS